MKDLGREIALGIVVFLALYKLVPIPHNAGLLLAAVHHGAVLVTAFFLPVAWKLFRYRELVGSIIGILSKDVSKRRGPVNSYAQYGIEVLGNRIDGLQRFPGINLDSEEEFREFSRACFNYASGSYYGVDTHCPSDWLRLYKGFLEEQSGKIHKDSARILAVDREQIRQDLNSYPNEFRRFYDWHRENGMSLLQIDPSQAREAADFSGIRAIDVALWVEDYAVIFWVGDKGRSQMSELKIQFLAQHDSGYREARSYIGRVNELSSEIRLSQSGSIYFREREDSERKAIREAVS